MNSSVKLVSQVSEWSLAEEPKTSMYVGSMENDKREETKKNRMASGGLLYRIEEQLNQDSKFIAVVTVVTR